MGWCRVVGLVKLEGGFGVDLIGGVGWYVQSGFRVCGCLGQVQGGFRVGVG